MKQVDNMYDGILIGHFDCLRTRDDVICTSFVMCDSFRSSLGFIIGNRSNANLDGCSLLVAMLRDSRHFLPRSLRNVGDVGNARVIARDILRERQR